MTGCLPPNCGVTRQLLQFAALPPSRVQAERGQHEGMKLNPHPTHTRLYTIVLAMLRAHLKPADDMSIYSEH